MAMLKFFMTPGSCTTGIHILLEELGLVFEVYPVNLLAGDHQTDTFKSMNPKSSIPVLVTEEGRAITEFQAIAWWLGRRHPGSGLVPEDLDTQVTILEAMDYVVGTLHMQGFARIFTTEKFSSRAEDHESVQARGREIVGECFQVLDRQLQGSDYLAGKFSVADAALFYTEFWADHLKMPMPANLHAHYQRMRARPIVQQVLREEGYSS